MESVTNLEVSMLKNTAISFYRKELDLALHLTARTGFITKACLRYITEDRGEAGNYRFIDAMNKSGMFRLWSYDLNFPAWTLSELGFCKAKAAGVRSVRPPDDDSFFHDSMLMNLALEFKRRGFVEAWATHLQLKKEGSDRIAIESNAKERRYSDVVMRTRGPRSTQIAIELELTRRSSPQYERLLRGYMGTTGISLLLVVYLDDRLPVLIERLAHQLSFPANALPIVFVDLRDIFHDHESGHARSKPDHEGFGRIIGQIRSALDGRERVSSLNFPVGGNHGIGKQAG